MAKRVQRPSGHFSCVDAYGNRVEGETRSCAHCGQTWIYRAHDKQFAVAAGIAAGGEAVAHAHRKRRGVCMSCHMVICAEPECMAKVVCPKGAPIDERIGMDIEKLRKRAALRDAPGQAVTLE